MRKIHNARVEAWRKKAEASWKQILESAEGRQPLKKPLLDSFVDAKKFELLGIKDWGVGQIDHSKWTSLDTNEWLLKKVATCKDCKFGDVVSAFSRNYDPQLRNQVKADLVAYHEDQEVFHW
jgi:hypothetical protein